MLSLGAIGVPTRRHCSFRVLENFCCSCVTWGKAPAQNFCHDPPVDTTLCVAKKQPFCVWFARQEPQSVLASALGAEIRVDGESASSFTHACSCKQFEARAFV